MHNYNNNKFLQMLTTPGRIPSDVAFAVGVAAMILIFALDFWTNREIQLHMLYIFPIALIIIHHKNVVLINFAIIFAILFMSITLAHYRLPTISAVANVLTALAAYGVMSFFAFSARTNYLKAMNSATVDSLTDLLNRRGFEPILDLEVARWRRYGEVFSLAMLDLDHFKQLNDEQGHAAGDEALKLFAEVLRMNIRESDTIARIGGDEFALIMPHARQMEGRILCEKLCRDVGRRMEELGFPVTASIGCKTFDDISELVEDALTEADKLMYEAKTGGKNRVVSA